MKARSAALLAMLLSLSVAVAQAPPEQPRDITGIEELPALPPPPRWPYWLAAGLAGTAGVCLVGWRITRRRPRAAPLPPDRWALQEIDRIAARNLPEAGETERFHTLVSDVVRRYLELRYDLHAPKQTTAEFLRSLGEGSPLPVETQAHLSEFLSRCDLAKFAPLVPSPDECRQTLGLARGIVHNPAVVTSKGNP